MKKTLAFGITLILILSAIGIAFAVPETVPAADQAKANSKTPENSPVIDEDWGLHPPMPFVIYSDNAVLKGMFGVRHEFPGKFSANLSPQQVDFLSFIGIETEPVQLYQVLGKPGCTCDNDGTCEPELGEHPSCCNDCKGGEEEPPEVRTCFPDSQMPWGVTMVNGGSGGAGANVAVLDTGANTEHLDLKRRITQCFDFTRGRKPKRGCQDTDGHGTNVAGIIAADGGEDGKGIFGVAPGANLLIYKVCGGGGCWDDDIAAAIDYAGNHGAEIVSMSLGGNTPSSLINGAIGRNPHLLFVAAAGNDGPAYGSIDYPGAYVEVIAVGAIDTNTTPPEWSSRGINDEDGIIELREVEFGAPGVLVESTYNDGCYHTYNPGGTSMATPHVSGLAAKLWQGNAFSTRSYLQSIAVDIWETGDDTATGFGLPVAS